MRSAINIVVTCTSRKKLRPERALCLRSVRLSDRQRRAELWIERLRTNESATSVAGDLYCGEHWTVVRSLPEVARRVGIQVRVWICSAGYGLISPDSVIKSYSATFAAGDVDSVSKARTGEQRQCDSQGWWESLCRWKGPGPLGIRTVAGIARHFPGSPLLVVASPGYLEAMERDLSEAIKGMDNADLLMIVSAGSRSHRKLGGHLLPCDARLQNVVGGTRASLNARIARHLLHRTGDNLTVGKASRYLKALLRRQPTLHEYSRIRMSDAQVRQFILHDLDNGASASGSLRRLRESGKACEQARFTALYRRIRGTK